VILFLFWVVKYFLLCNCFFFFLNLFAWLSFIQNPQLLQIFFPNFWRINLNLYFLIFYLFGLLISIVSVCLNLHYVGPIWFLAFGFDEGSWFKNFPFDFNSFGQVLVRLYFLFNQRLYLRLFQRVNCGFVFFWDNLDAVWERFSKFFLFQLFLIDCDFVFFIIDVLMKLSVKQRVKFLEDLFFLMLNFIDVSSHNLFFMLDPFRSDFTMVLKLRQ
jgi:hypothetical protein